MDIHLDQGRVANAVKTVDLPRLDDKDVPGTRLELFSIDGPEAAAFSHELHFIVRMTMGTRASSRQGAEQEGGDIDAAILRSNELMRASDEGKVLLTDSVRLGSAPDGFRGRSRPVR
jgi:hypothetical protein